MNSRAVLILGRHVAVVRGRGRARLALMARRGVFDQSAEEHRAARPWEQPAPTHRSLALALT